MKYLQLIQNEEYQAALNLINSSIKLNGVDKDLIQAKIFCLINLHKFALAISTIKYYRKLKTQASALDFSFELAYAFYRLGKFESALNVVMTITTLQPAYLILKAQILYRLERFEESSNIFLKLVQFFPENVELHVNYLASCALSGQKPCLKSRTIDLYDTFFNQSIISYIKKDFKISRDLAESCLKLADISEKDIVNAQILCICALIASGDNIPYAQALLKELSNNSTLDTIQEALITSNLSLFTNDHSRIDFKNMSPFYFQYQQFLANLYACDRPAFKKADISQIILKNKIQGIGIVVSEHEIAHYVSNISGYIVSAKDRNRNQKVVKILKNPTSPLDIERWKPLRDRSYYKKKMRKQAKK